MKLCIESYGGPRGRTLFLNEEHLYGMLQGLLEIRAQLLAAIGVRSLTFEARRGVGCVPNMFHYYECTPRVRSVCTSD